MGVTTRASASRALRPRRRRRHATSARDDDDACVSLSRAMPSKRARGARDAAPTSASKIQKSFARGDVARARDARETPTRAARERDARGRRAHPPLALAATHDRVRTLEVGLARVETTRRRARRRATRRVPGLNARARATREGVVD
jgi:hypothetical protein